MKKNFLKTFVYTSAITLGVSSFVPGASAQPAEPKLAQIHGEVDLTTTNNTTVIVELKEESLVESKQKGKKQTKENLKKVRDNVKQQAAKQVSNSDVKREYDYVFSGFSIELPASEIPKLLALDEVKAVYPNVTYQADVVPGSEEIVSEEEFTPNMLKSAPYIGSQKAWESGYTGKGVTVAVIDTGVDYTHPDLKHAFKDYKGWDFVDNDPDPQETPKGDPRGAETTHGTHVAGTVAANGGIKGVAPEAKLLAYRVLGPGGSGTTENVVASIEKAVRDGADVMNLSLGNSLNNADFATSIALDWAMAEGVVAVTSNGNSGPRNWTVGSPGTSRSAISVGATQLPFDLYSAVLPGYSSAKVMGYPTAEALLALSGKELELVNAGLGAPADFQGKDVKGKVAVIARGGGIPFVDKAEAAKAAGAIATVIYNNADGEVPDIPGMPLPSVKLTKAEGEKLVAQINSGNNKATFTFAFDKKVGETMADFSSRGPVVDTWMIKPDVSAPGVDIVSTVPTFNPANPHGYGSKQGTSMAAPHVAGAAALLLQAHPDWNVDDVKSSLMNNAEKLKDRNGAVYAHNSQGAGSIRVVESIETKTLVAPGSHSFGVFAKSKGKQVENQSFTIKNISKNKKTYSFEASFKNGNDAIKVKNGKNLTVNKGGSKDVNLNVQVDAAKLQAGYYEGSILVSDGSEVIEVPTILFIQEPDYPRVTSVTALALGANQFSINVYLPRGAEELTLYVYDRDLKPVGQIATYKNVGSQYQAFNWDGRINNVTLPAGQYQIAAFATKERQTNYSLTANPITIR
ncbi:S8 family serine peptidase [Bacillus lacus]|uniref:S8 family serine peptidase n=1 Tax=Metabacillus lacus TaxID=1983721 RepID=A0A7X2IWM1_9BACI|nr:S8 family serine peptidase [Metabacillus lacus]MRX71161.1 S8 family serine peptidase [Metabacillus lacus]